MAANVDVFQSAHLLCRHLFALYIARILQFYLCGLNGFAVLHSRNNGGFCVCFIIAAFYVAGREVCVLSCKEAMLQSRQRIGKSPEPYVGACDEFAQFTPNAERSASCRFQRIVDLTRFDVVIVTETNDFIYLFLLLLIALVALCRCKTYFVRFLRQSCIGVVLPEEDAVFGSGGEHAVWFIYALRHQVVDEDADVRLVASECQ